MNEKILEAKKAVVDEVNQTLVGSKCAVVVSYQGLKVSELNVLRKGLKSVAFFKFECAINFSYQTL